MSNFWATSIQSPYMYILRVTTVVKGKEELTNCKLIILTLNLPLTYFFDHISSTLKYRYPFMLSVKMCAIVVSHLNLEKT